MQGFRLAFLAVQPVKDTSKNLTQLLYEARHNREAARIDSFSPPNSGALAFVHLHVADFPIHVAI
jgi:hypothetical protein